ncbi:hypothetical protein BC829DRAFT_421792 [Chytridium lagenaria]|nr:hypothetical protein BC829DRAFT_421792 [Chytridium lagenaria]
MSKKLGLYQPSIYSVKESCNMSWSRNAILVVVLIAALLNVAAGLSVSSTRGADIDGGAISQVKNEAVSALNSAPAVAPVPRNIITVNNPSRTEAPTAHEIIPPLRAHFRELLKKSAFSKTIVQELGGWIYADTANPRRIMIVDAPKDRSKPSQDKKLPEAKGKGKERVLPNLSIDLNNPQASGVPANWVLVANYHTHPSLVTEDVHPSAADMVNAWARGVPGLVISRKGIYIYGPERRKRLNAAVRFYPNTNEEGNIHAEAPLVDW